MSKRLIRWPELAQILNGSLSRTSVYRLEKHGTFPKRINLGVNTVAWYEHEIMEWLNTRPRGPMAEPSASQDASQKRN